VALSLQTLIPILLDKTSVEVAAIQQGAEAVVFGLSTSISALNQTASFDREDAAIILEACREATRRRALDPTVTSASVPAPALAHTLRRSRQILWGP
jgi:hypothetical protein